MDRINVQIAARQIKRNLIDNLELQGEALAQKAREMNDSRGWEKEDDDYNLEHPHRYGVMRYITFRLTEEELAEAIKQAEI